jgi:hypothetical protein
MSKTFPKISTKNFDDSFSSTFFCFIAFSGVSQRWEFKITTKNVLQNKSCRKILQKIRPKIQNAKPTFSRKGFITFLGRFSMRGVQKHDKKNIEKINPTLVLGPWCQSSCQSAERPPPKPSTPDGWALLCPDWL